MSHRVIALVTIAVAMALAVVLGLSYAVIEHIPAWQGLYCSWMTAVTVGGDVSPTGWAGHLVLAADGLLVVPLVAATFSLLTSSLTTVHVGRQLTAHHRRILAAMAQQQSHGSQ